MSFVEKLGSLMQRPGEDLVSKDDVSPWMKYAGRGLGTAAGGLSMFFGIFMIIMNILSTTCIFGGIWQVVLGFTVLVIEAPCCCMFVDYVQHASEVVDKRPYWNRAAYYMVAAIPPLWLCFGFSSFLGSGLVFGTGVLYGMMALGKKANRDEMRNYASRSAPPNQLFPPANAADSRPFNANPFDSKV